MRQLTYPGKRTVQLVENHTDALLIGSVEVECLTESQKRIVLRIECEPPAESRFPEEEEEEKSCEDMSYGDSELEGIEVPTGFLEQLTFALMDGCSSCQCAPFKSALRKKREPYPTKNNRSVGFGCLEIHEFYLTLGDHPSAVSGPPVALDYSQDLEINRVVSLDEYEKARNPRRKRKQLKLSYKDRKNILEKHRGFSTDEVNQAWLEALKIRQQRQETLKRGLVMNMWDEVTESTQRKVYRAVEAVGLA